MKIKLLSLILIFIIFNVNAQVCIKDLPDENPNSRYDTTLNNGSTVTDYVTKLMWKRCSEGQVWNNVNCGLSSDVTLHNWQEALNIPVTLNAGDGYAGFKDWRLPNINELKSLITYKCYAPAFNETIFPNISKIKNFVSSSPVVYDNVTNPDSLVWVMTTTYGYAGGNPRDFGELVRLVRSSGQ